MKIPSKLIAKAATFVLIGAVSTTGMTFANADMKKEMMPTETKAPTSTMMPSATEERASLEATIEGFKVELLTLNDALKALESQHHAAKEANDTALMATHEASIATTKEQITAKTTEIMSTMKKLKKAVHKEFSMEALKSSMTFKSKLMTAAPNHTALGLESVIAKGHKFNFSTSPLMVDDQVLVPLRAMADAFGATVTWDEVTKTVTLVKESKTIEIHQDSKEVHVNGVKAELNHNAMRVNGTMYIPLYFIAAEFGFDVTWHAELKMAELTHKKVAASTEATTTDSTATEAAAPSGDNATQAPHQH